jgi:adenosine deaminase
VTLERFLQALPKVELHCHLYGTVRKETFEALCAKHKVPYTQEQIDGFYTRPRKPWPTNNVLRALDDQLVREPDDLFRLTAEYLEDAAKSGVRYTEFFWNPSATVQAGIPYAKAQDAIVAAIKDAKIIGRLIPAIDRERPVEAANEMVDWVIEHRRPEVPGIGIDFSEAERPPELFQEAYARARRAGLHVTAHAGENGVPWQNVKTAIELLKVERVDHGYTVIDNPDFARECAERGIVFTVVPTNSFYLRTLPDERWALDHPIRKMPKLGLRIHPNTDNPTLHKVTQTRAWQMMVEDFGFSLEDLRGFMDNGFDAAWIDDAQRARWRRDWGQEFDRLRSQLTV